MVDRDVVFGKVAIIKRCLQRIKDVTRLDPKSLDAIDAQEIFILKLQRAAQAAIDLAPIWWRPRAWESPRTSETVSGCCKRRA
jgi:hypothetical protein